MAQVEWSKTQEDQCKEIMKSHRCPIATRRALWKRLYKGVLVDGNKYFQFDNHGRLGVKLYARALTITWSSHPEYWTYCLERIPKSEYTVEVAHLENVCWLDVDGKFDMKKLNAEAEYEILFDIELTHGAEGWEYCEVTFKCNDQPELKKKLNDLIGKGPNQISIGKCNPNNTPLATFKMYEHSGNWKNGLIMRGVTIRPV